MPEFSPTNSIELKPIKDLLDLNYKNEPKYKFNVPSYQRGYKWGVGEVEYLLSDIWEFVENTDKRENEIYCFEKFYYNYALNISKIGMNNELLLVFVMHPCVFHSFRK